MPFATSAQRVDGGWRVNGIKHFISNGNRASHYLVMVQTDRTKTMQDGATCFLLERGHPGFTIGRVHDKMGERLANNAELVFQDCFIPDTNVVSPSDAVISMNLAEQTRKVLATLTPREEKVLRMRFGSGEKSAHTLEEVGQDFEVTRERIRQIEAKALRKMRHPTRIRQLQGFLEGEEGE